MKKELNTQLIASAAGGTGSCNSLVVHVTRIARDTGSHTRHLRRLHEDDCCVRCLASLWGLARARRRSALSEQMKEFLRFPPGFPRR